MYIIWGQHWFWKRFVKQVDKNNHPWADDDLIIYGKLHVSKQIKRW
jgi:hypothetical protein